jgi:IclR family transcriptional regulator, KDG regulon repressor
MVMRSESEKLVKSASRSLDIFELLAAEPHGLSISEISSRLGFARSSTHGLVHTLYSRGYLTQDESQRFSLGLRLIELGTNVVERLEVRTAARGPLEKLVEHAHDTALLVVPEDGELLYVDRVLSGERDVRTDPRISARRPLHCTSLGKALLAALHDDDVVDVLSGRPLLAVTEFTITDITELLEDLALTRERGYSVDRQEAVLGIWCVGAPVRDYTSRSIAAISVSTIREFFDPVATGPLVVEAAVEISRAMGWLGDAANLYAAVAGSELLLSDGTARDVRRSRSESDARV